jgi:hypothetical protein
MTGRMQRSIALGARASLLVALAACAKAEPERTKQVEAGFQAATTSVSTALPAPRRPEAQALAELLEAAPPSSDASMLEGSALRVGSKTDRKPKEAAPVAKANVEPPPSGRVTIRVPVSSPSLERASRAQLYWAFGRVCRLPSGELPPPDSITLQFEIHGDGSVLPSSVSASASAPELKPVAECIVRVFLASGFTGPFEGRGLHTSVHMTWPSVD